MPSCVLRYCKNNSRTKSKSEGITFHRFPRRGHKTREKWIKFVQINRSEETWLPSDHTCVCSLHFREEDKYTTKAGRRFLKNTAVPCCDPWKNDDSESIEPISEPVSDSESIFDSPQEIMLKQKLNKITMAKKKLCIKFKRIQRQNKNLKKKCEYLTKLVTMLKNKQSLDDIPERNLGLSSSSGTISALLLHSNTTSITTAATSTTTVITSTTTVITGTTTATTSITTAATSATTAIINSNIRVTSTTTATTSISSAATRTTTAITY